MHLEEQTGQTVCYTGSDTPQLDHRRAVRVDSTAQGRKLLSDVEPHVLQRER